METVDTKANKAIEGEESLKIMDILYMCLSKWYWFVASLAITLLVAFFYINFTPPTYLRTTSIMIKDESKGSLSAETSAFAEIGLMQTKTNVNNEMISMKSSDVMTEVVKRLGLNVQYKTDGRFYNPVLYGRTLPVSVEFHDLNNSETANFTVKLNGGEFSLTDFVLNGQEIVADPVSCKIGEVTDSPVGKITVKANPYYVSGTFDKPVYVAKHSLGGVVAGYTNVLDVKLRSEKASVIDISIVDVSTQKADDILNTLIAVYNEKWIQDRNQIARSTSNFIDERLAVIEKELGLVDDDISTFKSKHLVPDIQAVSNMYMSQSSATNARIMELNTQISMARYVKSYMNSSVDKFRLFPVNSGLDDSGIATQVNNYNTMVLERNSLVANSGENNPLVADLDKTLAALHSAILASVDEQITTLTMQMEELQKTEAKTNERIAEGPSQAKYLLSVERQQKVKESLYLFLLQKREENELSQAFTAYNTRMITKPGGSMVPVTPVKKKIILIAILLGLMIPAGIIVLLELLNTRIQGRKDIDGLSMPFVGEIPMSYRKKKHFIRRWKKDVDKREIVVKEKSRNMINEAFRVVRTNFEFILGDGKSKVVMTSSMNPGSGKTFITMNLATALAIKGKKVMLIDLDMRKAALSEFIGSPKKGVSDFLNGIVGSYKDVTVSGTIHRNLDVLPVGTIPPNPTELLFEDRLPEMIESLRSEYDYIFVDCPPVEIVADSAIINKYVDMTLFIVRADLLEKAMLPEIESFYTEKKYRNLCLILNGTQDAYGGYGYHRYGYSYGYHSYGYGEDE
ncbi:MAG: polysaccharide biosynthesis tyrosine autokinase [Clostridium sp.]|nr:polysaccharide biosynthesis tyrosine autokinase [Bacteroides sp.]MCM1198891.1 polysaccharide biosynthesis tyrosine autokinase [Clostridium sp.]